jgi:hypothetical protein
MSVAPAAAKYNSQKRLIVIHERGVRLQATHHKYVFGSGG